jgi:hypothetical protein
MGFVLDVEHVPEFAQPTQLKCRFQTVFCGLKLKKTSAPVAVYALEAAPATPLISRS